jgi:DNA invertase Pin-like site-specific DNA recombinase
LYKNGTSIYGCISYTKTVCTEIFTDVASGVKVARPGLEDALNYMRGGDTLVVWKLDRLGRSIQHLFETAESLTKRNIGFKSLQENIDTTTSSGKLTFHIFGALAEFELDLINIVSLPAKTISPTFNYS